MALVVLEAVVPAVHPVVAVLVPVVRSPVEASEADPPSVAVVQVGVSAFRRPALALVSYFVSPRLITSIQIIYIAIHR
jgi:hypothetical protein